MNEAAEELAARIRSMGTIAEPWPHATLDDFLPFGVFANLMAFLGTQTSAQRNFKVKTLPEELTELLRSRTVLDAIRDRFGFVGGHALIEASYTAKTGLTPHVDRPDKLWSGQVYLAGDPVGTELFDAAGNLAHKVEWRPNRLACWTRPANLEKHTAPKSKGRWVLLYWIMQGE